MASMNVSGRISFSDDVKKPKKKKKKAKKEKREKSDKLKLKIPFAEIPEIQQKKRKETPDVWLNEEIFLTQSKKRNPSKRRRNAAKCTTDGCNLHRAIGSVPSELETAILSSTQKEKKCKKRVAFNLPAVLLRPRPTASSAGDVVQTQRSGSEPPPSDGPQSGTPTAENRTESQSTSDDINSQDLFITQKWFSEAYIDLCSSTSAEEAPEPPDDAETCPQPPARKRSLTKIPPCPALHPAPPARRYHHRLDASTQTENFFTSPFRAASLHFRHRSACTEEALDLSLPGRSRLGRWESNATDLTQSGDGDSHSKTKADLSQIKVVQTRLNESFFFRIKGEEDSPKPRSPLMKFSGGVDKKKA